MKTHLAISCIVILLTAANAQSYTPRDGFVPDSTAAIKVAEAVLIPVYGKEKMESERPFKPHKRCRMKADKGQFDGSTSPMLEYPRTMSLYERESPAAESDKYKNSKSF